MSKKRRKSRKGLGIGKVLLIMFLVILLAVVGGGLYLLKAGYIHLTNSQGENLAAIPLLANSSPEEQFKRYVDYLNRKDYEGMYNLLSRESREKITKADFVARNQDVYDRVRASDVEVEFAEGLKFGDSITYTMRMNTVVGEIVFDNQVDYAREDGNFRLQWNDAVIFPDMEPDSTISVTSTQAVRGQIFDRNGVLLAGNGEGASIGLVPGKMDETSVPRLAKVLNSTEESIQRKLSASWVTDTSFVPVRTLGREASGDLYWPLADGTRETLKEDALTSIPGVMLQSTTIRVYPLGAAAAHLVGYVQGISAEELEADTDKVYTASSQIGKAGLEILYEKRLRGEPGHKLNLVSADGEVIRVLGHSGSGMGEDITLTIDANLQQMLYESYKYDAGTSVAMNPYSGEVMAMVSTPSYDTNMMIFGVSQEVWDSWNNDPKIPLLNRFRATFVPGSTMKTITGLIGSSSGKVKYDTRFKSSKSWQSDSTWGSYKVTSKHIARPATMNNALVVSDNVYFAKAAIKIGADTMVKYWKNLGFGEEMPFPIAMGVSSYANRAEITSKILLADSGYGQGQMLVNPLHLACMYTTLLNDGSMLAPQLELGAEKTIWKEKVFKAGSCAKLLDSLKRVVSSSKGSAHAAYMKDCILAGKTGTAEIKATQMDQNGSELGWFVSFTPNKSQDKALLICSMVEDVKNRDGSKYVVKKTRNVYHAWYNGLSIVNEEEPEPEEIEEETEEAEEDDDDEAEDDPVAPEDHPMDGGAIEAPTAPAGNGNGEIHGLYQ